MKNRVKSKKKLGNDGLYFTWTDRNTIKLIELSGGRESATINMTKAQIIKLLAFGFGLDVKTRTGPNAVTVVSPPAEAKP